MRYNPTSAHAIAVTIALTSTRAFRPMLHISHACVGCANDQERYCVRSVSVHYRSVMGASALHDFRHCEETRLMLLIRGSLLSVCPLLSLCMVGGLLAVVAVDVCLVNNCVEPISAPCATTPSSSTRHLPHYRCLRVYWSALLSQTLLMQRGSGNKPTRQATNQINSIP